MANFKSILLLSSSLMVPLFATQALSQNASRDPGVPPNLEGRINDMVKPNVPNLNMSKTGEGVSDYKSNTPAPKGKELKGFPQTFEGAWAGTVVIDDYGFAEDIVKAQPEAVQQAVIRMHPGRESTGSMSFVVTPNGITFGVWPRFDFVVGIEDTPLMKPGVGLQPHMGWFIGTAPAKDTQLTDGSIKNSKQILNRIVEFKPGAVEMDSQEVSVDAFPKSKTYTVEARENVMHFLLLSPTEMQFSIAQIDYRGDGKFKSKLIMHGILKLRSGPKSVKRIHSNESFS